MGTFSPESPIVAHQIWWSKPWFPLDLMVKTMVSCKFSLKPMPWTYHFDPFWGWWKNPSVAHRDSTLRAHGESPWDNFAGTEQSGWIQWHIIYMYIYILYTHLQYIVYIYMYNYVCIAIYTKERNTWFALCMVPVAKIVYAWRLSLHRSPSSQLRGFSSRLISEMIGNG